MSPAGFEPAPHRVKAECASRYTTGPRTFLRFRRLLGIRPLPRAPATRRRARDRRRASLQPARPNTKYPSPVERVEWSPHARLTRHRPSAAPSSAPHLEVPSTTCQNASTTGRAPASRRALRGLQNAEGRHRLLFRGGLQLSVIADELPPLRTHSRRVTLRRASGARTHFDANPEGARPHRRGEAPRLGEAWGDNEMQHRTCDVYNRRFWRAQANQSKIKSAGGRDGAEHPPRRGFAFEPKPVPVP